MWTALRELFAGVPAEQRVGLAIAVGALLIVALGILVFFGLDLNPFWTLLGGQ